MTPARSSRSSSRMPTCPTSEVAACEICMRCQADFVKTSTGFAPSGATRDDLILMKRTVGAVCRVKAAGGVRTLDGALEVYSLAATASAPPKPRKSSTTGPLAWPRRLEFRLVHPPRRDILWWIVTRHACSHGLPAHLHRTRSPRRRAPSRTGAPRGRPGRALLEFRLDYLPSPEEGIAVIREFLRLYPDATVLATCRRHQNHGRFNGSIEEELRILAAAIEAARAPLTSKSKAPKTR